MTSHDLHDDRSKGPPYAFTLMGTPNEQLVEEPEFKGTSFQVLDPRTRKIYITKFSLQFIFLSLISEFGGRS